MITTQAHALCAEGAAHDDDGRRIDPLTASGLGRGRCSCGQLSEPLSSRNQRVAWHRQHRAFAATEAGQLADAADAILEDHAIPLVTMVRTEGQPAIERHVRSLDRGELEILAVTLAAMVPDDRTPRELLAWTTTIREDSRRVVA